MKRIGRYRVEGVLGSGAFATVWRAYDPELAVPVAIKVLAENWVHHSDVRDRFLREAQVLRRIDSSRVVRVHDIGSEAFPGGEQPYFVMDFADGGTLLDAAASGLATAEAVRLAIEACRGVQVVHDAGVLHRDVKPSNLLISAGQVQVADLGSLKEIANSTGYTVTTGTPSYMAPEQVTGTGIDSRTDVYALAVLTYALICGALPFDVSDPLTLLRRTASERPERLAVQLADRPEPTSDRALLSRLDTVLCRAMALDPNERHRTPDALADELQRVTEGQRPRRRPGWPVWVVIPAAVVIFAVAAACAWWVLR